MNKSRTALLLLLIAVGSGFQSCFVAKEYSRPEVSELSEDLFRTDQIPEDSVSMADVSWREMFTDPILVQHIETGLANNIDIRVALQQMEVANAYYQQGRAGFFPSFGLNAQVTHQELSRNSQFGEFFDGGITQYEISGTLGWEADIWGKIRSTKRASFAGYLQSVEAHKAVKTQLISQIATVYFQLLTLDAQLAVVERTVENRSSSLETTSALKSAGIVTEVAVKQTEAQLYNAEAMVVDLRREIAWSENTLSLLLGGPPQKPERSTLDAQGFNVELETGLPVLLLRNRPDVAAAEQGFVQAFELTNIARANFYPSLTLSATGGLQSLQLDQLLNVNSLFANLVGGLAQPVFNRRQIKTQYEISQAQQEQSLLEFKRTILIAGKEVSDALYAYAAADEKIEIKQREFESLDTATKYSEELLNNGLANYLEVLTARENALSSEVSVTTSEFERLRAIVELYRALGGGWR